MSSRSTAQTLNASLTHSHDGSRLRLLHERGQIAL